MLVVSIIAFPPPSAFASENSLRSSRYFNLGVKATDWITSFEVTSLNKSWGIPYQNPQTWGLDPYYFENGTITAETAGIVAGEKQQLAFLIGGHDSGLAASAALGAYLHTKNPKYLEILGTYLDYFRNSQIPNGHEVQSTKNALGQNVTIDNSGFWAEQADVSAGPDGRYGTADDSAVLHAVFPAAEHGNPIADALISYYRWTHDFGMLQLLNRYGSWLVRTQIKAGNYSGAFPVTQYYFALGWKPRMFENSESAWILAELYLLTGNRTYLDSAVAAGEYMLSRQFTAEKWVHTTVFGALPYESNGAKYTYAVSTNHAGFTLLAWAQLFRLTGNMEFLIAAEMYANWLLSFQVTPATIGWGNHTYANDSMAVGGYYYGYDTEKHEYDWRVALSLWSAAYAIRGLLLLSQTTKNATYLDSALLAADWLTGMRYADASLIPLQALAITKYVSSSWWGLYPQFYQPEMSQVEKAGIPSFVNSYRLGSSALQDPKPTWFERTFDVNFNLADYEMASRGPQFMKMIWGWWPSVGFEPRYGGDIAFGTFAIANYLSFNNSLMRLEPMLGEINQLTSDASLGIPANIKSSSMRIRQLVIEAQRNFNASWYTPATSQIDEASGLAQETIKELGMLVPILQTNRNILLTLATIIAVFAAIDAYVLYKLKHSSYRRGPKRRR